MVIDLKFYFKVFLSRITLFLTVFMLICAGGIAFYTSLPKVYETQASLLVEGSQIPSDLAASTVRTDVTDQIQIIRQKLSRRENVMYLAERFGFYADRPDMQPNQIVAGMLERISMRLSMGRGQATIFTIAAEADDAQTAADLVNELVKQVLDEDAAFRTEVATNTLAFFESDVRRLGEQLSILDRQILDFQNENIDALPETLEFRLSRQSLLQERLTVAQREVSQLSEQRRRLVELFETTGSTNVAPDRPLTAEEIELQQLRTDLREALAVFSETSHRVIVLRRQIEQLEALIEARVPETQPTDTPSGSGLFRAQVVEIDTQIKTLQESAGTLEKEIAVLQDSMERTPQNTIVLSAMERERASIQNQYDNAVERLSAAATGERIEVSAKGQRLSLIENALAPIRPSKPNELLIAAGTLLAGFVLGLGAVVLKELLQPTIRRPIELTRSLGVTPIGTLPYMETPGEIWLRRGMRGVAVIVVLAGIAGGLFLVDQRVMPFEQVARIIMQGDRL